MRRYHGGLLISAACAALVACGGGGSPIPGEAPADSPVEVTTTTSDTDTDTGTAPTTTTRERTTRDDPPGVPGSPVNYDSTVKPAGPQGARDAILRELRELCGPGRCGVTVRIVGSGDCVPDISPDPVPSGGRITITAAPCGTSTVESTSDSSAAEETSG